MTPARRQRLMMAAHSCDLAAKAFRTGDGFAAGPLLAAHIVDSEDAERLYRNALACYGVDIDDVDASVRAINDGKHPAISLPGRVAIYMDAAKGAAEAADTLPRISRFGSRAAAAEWLMDQLGVQVKP